MPGHEPHPDDDLPRGIIIASGPPGRHKVPFWAYHWSAADDGGEEEPLLPIRGRPPTRVLAPVP